MAGRNKFKLHLGRKVNNELSVARQQWYEAYVSGNLDRLAQFEAAELIVIGPGGIEGRAERLANIAAAVAGQRWFPTGSHGQDDRIDFCNLSNDVVSTWTGQNCHSTRSGFPGIFH